jgi:hypothetical protein
MSTCTIEDCSGKHYARGYCPKHYMRNRTHGDPSTVFKPSPPKRDVVSYSQAHRRIRESLGRAPEHACAQCADPAHQWAYNHEDPAKRMSTEGYPYSMNPEYYTPLCRSCHVRFDFLVRA